MLQLLTGGARSGKSALAVRMAAARAAEVVYVATATAGDGEMAARIARHRAERPPGWQTIEEPVDLLRPLAAAPPEATVIVDCLSLWLMNVLHGDDERIGEQATAQAAAAAARDGVTIAVTNEVGSGIVPGDPYTRRYRDLLGRVNTVWSLAADEAYLVVAGRVLPLRAPDDVLP